jgi:hypothetical protein
MQDSHFYPSMPPNENMEESGEEESMEIAAEEGQQYSTEQMESFLQQNPYLVQFHQKLIEIYGEKKELANLR